jgi:excisionase family DNA binding protein
MAEVGTRQFYGMKYAAQFFGVHPYTVKRWVKSGKVPGKKIGGRYYIAKESLETLLK